MAIADKVTTAVMGNLTTATAALDKATTAVVPREPVGAFDQGFPLGIADMVSLALVVLISMGVAALVTAFAIKLARALGAVDVPDDRSSHKIPTPRFGGFGYYVPLMIFLVGVMVKPGYLYGPAWGIEPALKTFLRLAIVCGSLAFVIGLMDDLLRLPPWFKLLGQIVCAALFVYLGSKMVYTVTGGHIIEGTHRIVPTSSTFKGAGFEHVVLTQGLILDGHWANLVAKMEKIGPWLPSLPAIVTVLWIVIFMNAYNFMDGIDGLAGVFLIAVAIGVFAIYVPEAGQNMLGLRAHVCVAMVMAGLFVGTSLGFLFYNRPPARTFLGDCGSQYIGFLLPALLVQLTRVAAETPADFYNKEQPITLPDRVHLDLLALLILVWPFLYDVTYTLIRRLVRLRPIWRAHHEHLYQRLIDLDWSHRGVVLFSLPFYLAHAAIFYMYCWAANDRMRWTWAGVALAPMILYTLIVITCEMGRRPAQAAADAPASDMTVEETTADDETAATDENETESAADAEDKDSPEPEGDPDD